MSLLPHRADALVVLALVAVALAPASAGAVAPGATASGVAASGAVASTGSSGPPSVGLDAGGDPGVAPAAQTPCDYASLYDRAIDSVVLVRTQRGQGSGFVYPAAGENGSTFVVTNEHVVSDAERVDVRFREGEYRRGRVVGTDTYSDLAVIRVPDAPTYAEALPVADEPPEPGDPVAALGSPFGLAGTITHGIVSGVDRSMPTDRGFTIPNVIQTDAPINPGNSGGPLLDCGGTVLGVNTAGGAENIGFAVSATMIEEVVPALIETGEYDHAYLGVRVAELTPELAEANDLETTQGVLIVETVPGGPAAGVLRGSTLTTVDGQQVPVGGDVVVAIENRSIETSEDLASYLATGAAPGETVDVTVIRDGTRQTVAVTLGERPPPSAASRSIGRSLGVT